jgi:hypothetical protein
MFSADVDLKALAPRPFTLIVQVPVLSACGKIRSVNPSGKLAGCCVAVTVYAAPVPAVVFADVMSLRNSLTRAMTARAELFTVEGFCPSDQFIVLSASSLSDAVVLHAKIESDICRPR